MVKRTITIDTDNNLVELSQQGYNIIERTIYDDEIVNKATELLKELVYEKDL